MKTYSPFRIERLVRQRPGKPCKHCGKSFLIGSDFLVVYLFTGFTNGKIGAFHEDCWPIFKPTITNYLKTKWGK